MEESKLKKNSRSRPPAFQFYAMDWLTDPSLRLCSAETRGVWIDLLCFMFLSNQPGFLIIADQILDQESIQKYSGIDPKRFKTVWKELIGFGILKRDDRGIYYSKRMIEDQRIREIRREAGKLGGNPKLKEKASKLVKQKPKQKPTPSTSTSTSFTSSYDDVNTNNGGGDEFEILNHPLIEFIRKDLPAVGSLKNQLTEEQASELERSFGLDPVKEILLSMENFKKLKTNYVSVYLTAVNWLKRRKDGNSENQSKSGSRKIAFGDALRGF